MQQVFARLNDLIDILDHLDCESELNLMASAIADCFRDGGKILTAGNGGSAAEASHLAAEFVGRFDKERSSYPAICLNSDGALLTCLTNDYPIQQMYARQIEGLSQPGDVLVMFSTSGNSPNLVDAFGTCEKFAVKTVALLGKGGGRCAGMSDYEIIVKSDCTARIQEVHQFLMHVLCEKVEDLLIIRKAIEEAAKNQTKKTI